MQIEEEKVRLAEQVAKETERQRQLAEDLRNEQIDLINVVSHEMRSPISAILNNAEVARDSLKASRDQLRSVQSHRVSVNQLQLVVDALTDDIACMECVIECALAQSRVANDVLSYGSMTANKYSIARQPTNLIESFRKSIAVFATECKSKQISLDIEFDANIQAMPYYEVDPQRINQILINLIANAIRFLGEPSAASNKERSITCIVKSSSSKPDCTNGSCISVDSKPQEKDKPHYICVEIADTGPGMTSEESSRLFQRFSQSTPITHAEFGGSGLGLFVARRLCALQNGDISLHSVKGVGTTFAFYIEARQCNPPSGPRGSVAAQISSYRIPQTPSQPSMLPQAAAVVAEQKASHQIGAANSSSDSGNTLGRLRLLAVDDNAINRSVLSRQLMQAGHFVATASNGLEALECIKTSTQSFDCMLIDVEMPVLGGIDAVRQLRDFSDGKQGTLPAIFITGSMARVKEALATGHCLVVTKPYRFSQITDALAQLIEE